MWVQYKRHKIPFMSLNKPYPVRRQGCKACVRDPIR